MEDLYLIIDDYNLISKRKIWIEFDDATGDTTSNKKIESIVK